MVSEEFMKSSVHNDETVIEIVAFITFFLWISKLKTLIEKKNLIRKKKNHKLIKILKLNFNLKSITLQYNL